MPFFKITKKEKKSRARVGIIKTDHGIIETPVFMPVGTSATVKGVNALELKRLQTQIVLCNTYHLFIRPGVETLNKSGGIHKFQNWPKPILSDSGGYQVFSLNKIRKISDDGVMFNSHIDGSKFFFSPENVMEYQRIIGADIIMAFDECTEANSDYLYAKQSLNKTNAWLDRCLNFLSENDVLYDYNQYFFPIVQGGVYSDLRKFSCNYVVEKNACGFAFGGLSVGEPEQAMYEISDLCCENLPVDKPRYLMGVGTPKNILNCIELGIDMFDCVMPTRNGRNGMLFPTNGVINITNLKWKNDFSVIDENLHNSPISQYYSKSYLRHLFINKELLAYQIASIQNIAFYMHLIEEAKKQIVNENFVNWKNKIIPLITQKM